jgi:AcrR family transcriptional regulator
VPQLGDKILHTAARLFGSRRFHEVRMEDIAAAAEVGKGTLYRYFRDKEELYLALLALAAEQLMDSLHQAIAPMTGSEARLRRMVETILIFFDEQPHLLDLITRAEVLRGASSPWHHTRDEVTRFVLQVFEEGHARGEFHLADPELAALMLLGGIRSVIRFGHRPRPADLACRIVHTLLHGHGRAGDCPGGNHVAPSSS